MAARENILTGTLVFVHNGLDITQKLRYPLDLIEYDGSGERLQKPPGIGLSRFADVEIFQTDVSVIRKKSPG